MSPALQHRENRHRATELKFLIPRDLALQIAGWAETHLSPDPYANGGTYLITSLYCDTQDFGVYHRRQSHGRSKYRIRRYGRNESVYLERKLRTRQILSKRRSLVAIPELTFLAHPGRRDPWVGAWFHARLLLRGLEPACQISYQRQAFVGRADGASYRLTIDRDIAAATAKTYHFQNPLAGRPILPPDHAVLELKFTQASPTIFKRLIEEFRLNPSSFSKYRTAARALGLISADALATAHA